jgi:uncharacterized membrane protein YgcG
MIPPGFPARHRRPGWQDLNPTPLSWRRNEPWNPCLMLRLTAILMASLLLTACGIRSTVQQYAMNLRDRTRDSYAADAAIRNPRHAMPGDGGDMRGPPKPKPGDARTPGGQATGGQGSSGGQAAPGGSSAGGGSAAPGGQTPS